MLMCKVTLGNLSYDDFLELYVQEDARKLVDAWLRDHPVPTGWGGREMPWAHLHRTSIPGLSEVEVPS